MSIEKTPKESAPRIERRSALVLGVAAASTFVLGAKTPAEAARASHRVKITVLYNPPKDAASFEKYYAETHLPLAGKMQGVKRIELSKVAPGPDGAAPPVYRIAELYFTNQKQMEKVMATDAAKAVVADIPNFATGGYTVLVSAIG